MPPATMPTRSNATPIPDSTGSSTSPIGPTIALIPPKNSAEPFAMPSPRPANGISSNSPSRELATPSESMPAPKSSIRPRSMADSDPPSRAISSAAGPRFAKNGSRSAPLLPKICMAAAVRLAGSSMPCNFSPTKRICSSGLRFSKSANETPSLARDSVAALLSSSAPASVFCSFPNALLTDSIETPERLPASSNSWMNSNETPSLSAVLPSFSTRSSRSSSPLATALAPAANAVTAASPTVNGFTSPATEAPMLESPPARPAPPPKTLPSPCPADDSPDSRPATLPIGPGRADSTPDNSLNFIVPPPPALWMDPSNLPAALVAFANSCDALLSAELYVSCEMRPAARWPASSWTWASYFSCGERLACVICAARESALALSVSAAAASWFAPLASAAARA